MDEKPVVIELTGDQAFVLSDWLYEAMFKSDDLRRILWEPEGEIPSGYPANGIRRCWQCSGVDCSDVFGVAPRGCNRR